MKTLELIRKIVGPTLIKSGMSYSAILRRAGADGVDENGIPTEELPTIYKFEGFRDNYREDYRAAAGIPDTDFKIIIYGTSIALVPQQDDYILFRDQWVQVRQVMIDPADAVYECQCYNTGDPDT